MKKIHDFIADNLIPLCIELNDYRNTGQWPANSRMRHLACLYEIEFACDWDHANDLARHLVKNAAVSYIAKQQKGT